MKIFLIGFMGSGKSLIGRHLAKRLGLSFLDLDDFLEKGEKKSIREIFAESGEDEFRKLEKIYLNKTSDLRNHIVATGGGTPCFFENMEWMKANGLTIFLNVNPEILCERLQKESEHRPLLIGNSDKELLKFIESKLNFRLQFYKQAEVTCQADKGFAEIIDDLELILQDI